MKIQILGTGCSKCNKLEKRVKEAVANTTADAMIEKITDIDTIAEMGVMLTPALLIDDKVVTSGKVSTAEQIASCLRG